MGKGGNGNHPLLCPLSFKHHSNPTTRFPLLSFPLLTSALPNGGLGKQRIKELQVALSSEYHEVANYAPHRILR